MSTAAPPPLLSVRGVTKSFGALTAVNNLSFDVVPGEILGIGGPNGAGKTTLFEVISGLNPATAGSIVFDGSDITHAAPEAICHAGIARTFQLNAGFDSMSVRDTVRVAAYFGRQNRVAPGLSFGGEVEAQVDEAIAAVGLAGREHLVTGPLPVLDRKLLMLASAIATGPKLLLMDEPVGGLNAKEIDQMIAALATLAFLTTLWLLIVVGAAVLEKSSGQILAALRGESHPATIATRPVQVRHPHYRAERAHRSTVQLRAAA